MSYRVRIIEEYKELKGRLERLHRILIKHRAGTLDFELECPPHLLEAQEDAMRRYMELLEIKAEYMSINLGVDGDE